MDKAALAGALGAPSVFGQSQFAFMRGNAFEARVKADGGAELLRLVHTRLDPGAEPPERAAVPDLSASGPEGRTARTTLALREAAGAPGTWTLLDHPMLALDVAGSPAFLEPDAVVVHPDGSWTVVEIKSFPMLDGAADPAKVGAAARQAAVYVLALEQVASRLTAAPAGRDAPGTPAGPGEPSGTGPGGSARAEDTPAAGPNRPAAGSEAPTGPAVSTPTGPAPDGTREAPTGTRERPDGPPEAPAEPDTSTATEPAPDGTRETPDDVRETPDGARETPDDVRETPDGARQAPRRTGATPDEAREAPAGPCARTPTGPAYDGTRETPDKTREAPAGSGAPRVRQRVLLVCPKDFSNLPTASVVDVRRQRAVTARQLARLTRVQEIADTLPEGTCFSPGLPRDELTAAVESVPATYAPECLAACELAFHCRGRSRAADAVTALGRPVRAELGDLTTVEGVLAAARGESGDPDDPAVAALRRAAALRAEALAAAVPAGLPAARAGQEVASCR